MIEWLARGFTAPIYAFFKLNAMIEYNKRGEHHHAFTCAAEPCQGNHIICRNLTTKNKSSTHNMISHVKTCWGDKVVNSAMTVGSATAASDILKVKGLKDGSITMAFERAGNVRLDLDNSQSLWRLKRLRKQDKGSLFYG